jgi:hypothetical protein
MRSNAARSAEQCRGLARASLGRRKWRAAQPNIRDTRPRAATCANLARIADVEQRNTNEMIGAELAISRLAADRIRPGEGPQSVPAAS